MSLPQASTAEGAKVIQVLDDLVNSAIRTPRTSTSLREKPGGKYAFASTA